MIAVSAHQSTLLHGDSAISRVFWWFMPSPKEKVPDFNMWFTAEMDARATFLLFPWACW